MKKIEDLNFYELLEISPTASIQEIHRAYERIRRVYDPNSIALYSLFSAEETAAIHQRIEDAYRTLLYEDNRKRYDATLRGGEESHEPPPPQAHTSERRPVQPALTPPLPLENRGPDTPAQQPPIPSPEPAQAEAPPPLPPFTGEFTGPAIKTLREQRGQTLQAIAELTKVSIRYLGYIEEEAFQKLPVRTYLRGFLILFAKALGCDPERLSSDYLKRYETSMKPAAKK